MKWFFNHWQDGDVNVEKTVILAAASDVVLTAYYSLAYTLTIASGPGGTTSPAPGAYSVAENSVIQVTAVPDPNYRFVSWNLDGAVSAENPKNVIMNVDHTLQPVFEYVPPPPQTATLTGHVTDADTGNPIPGATVAGDGYADITETDGLYELAGIPAKAYGLTVSKEGYKSQNISVDASAGGTFTRDVSMEPEAPPTAPTIFDRLWSGFEEFSGKLKLPVPPKPAQPPKLPIEE